MVRHLPTDWTNVTPTTDTTRLPNCRHYYLPAGRFPHHYCCHQDGFATPPPIPGRFDLHHPHHTACPFRHAPLYHHTTGPSLLHPFCRWTGLGRCRTARRGPQAGLPPAYVPPVHCALVTDFKPRSICGRSDGHSRLLVATFHVVLRPYPPLVFTTNSADHVTVPRCHQAWFNYQLWDVYHFARRDCPHHVATFGHSFLVVCLSALPVPVLVPPAPFSPRFWLTTPGQRHLRACLPRPLAAEPRMPTLPIPEHRFDLTPTYICLLPHL